MSNYKLFETEEFIERIEEFSKVEKSFLQRKLTSYVYPQLKLEPHFGLNIKKLIDYVPRPGVTGLVNSFSRPMPN